MQTLKKKSNLHAKLSVNQSHVLLHILVSAKHKHNYIKTANMSTWYTFFPDELFIGSQMNIYKEKS